MSVKKIAIISTSLDFGGAERFSGLLSIMLTDLGHEVHVIIIENFVKFPFQGKLFNLGALCNGKFSLYNKLSKGFLLNKYLTENKIETIIDNRTRNLLLRDLITHFIFRKFKKIEVVHSAILSLYFSEIKFVNRLLYGNSSKIVCVSKEIEQKINKNFNLKNTVTIYNTFLLNNDAIEIDLKLPKKYFLYFGRLEENPKNLLFLIKCFAESKVYDKNFHLLLVGDGSSKLLIQQKINNLQLNQYIKIEPFTLQINKYILNAKATVLTSNYEGFPLSVIESLALGTPVISVDCESGPKEIIVHNYNGLLVEKNNCVAFANALSTFVNDNEKYQYCKFNSKPSIAHLDYTVIKNQWAAIL